MVDTTFLERANKTIERTQQKLRSVANLIKAGEIRQHGDVLTVDNGIVLETIYTQGSTVTTCKARYAGGRVPGHIHEKVTQYLICVKGSFNIQFPNGHRILLPSACASIPSDWEHSVTALEDDSELIAVCVPPEKGYIPKDKVE